MTIHFPLESTLILHSGWQALRCTFDELSCNSDFKFIDRVKILGGIVDARASSRSFP